ncbi:hypothetical protein TNCV_419671 [Trichonephila clavipes]|uniref:Uncharacterized protein n=1 Tax=Trichonephila clavipes TaxID=2585209 RepID=A0A8X6RZL2_TRICX|nr:hypothetical protein TNCV_419671 [Trichonephila clavipes]
MRSNKSGLLRCEATTIHAMRSSTVATSVSYKRDYRRHQKENFKGLRSGESEGQATGSLCPIHHQGYVACRWLHAIEKRAEALSCINQKAYWLVLLLVQ